MKELEESALIGFFKVSADKEISGELKLAGPNTKLYVWDKEFINVGAAHAKSIQGVLHDLSKVTLISCGTAPLPNTHSVDQKVHYFANVYPEFVTIGQEHILPDENCIKDVHFVIDDATSLFYDFDAFGHVINAVPLIQEVVKANEIDRKIEIGSYPQIAYFTGKTDILSIDTIFGTVSVTHSPSMNLGGPEGVKIGNTIFVNLHAEKEITFHDAIDRTAKILRFLELLAGRRQNLSRLVFRIKADARVQVYWSLRPRRETSNEDRKPHPSDVLLNGGMEPEAFAHVLKGWLEREQLWGDARTRFFSSFFKERYYDIDRLIAAANMFDILPSCAVPSDVSLAEDLRKARDECRTMLRSLPLSPERDSILSALGRLGKSNLKQKIQHRAEVVNAKIGERFPELSTVINEAVDCRNYYVHGGDPKFDYNNSSTLVFFTDTLEFIFAASDLIEAGWDVKAWIKKGTTMSHRYGEFRVAYKTNLEVLKRLLAEEKLS